MIFSFSRVLAMKLKTLLAITALYIPSFVVFSPEKAHALPFKENCASMQAYANALNWSTPTKFSGFENISMVNYGFIFCNGGYVKEISPMGTRICRSSLVYGSLDPQRPINWAPLNGSSSNCRWM